MVFYRNRERGPSGHMSGGETYRIRNQDMPNEYTWSHNSQGGIPKKFEKISDSVHSGPPYIGESDLYAAKTTIMKRTSIDAKYSNRGTRRARGFDPYIWTTSHMNLGGPLGVQSYVNKAFARLNPNNPMVDVPLFLFELREYPRLLKHLGDLLRRPRNANIADSVLAYKFGWAPLYGDLNTLANLVEEIEQEKAHIGRMAQRKHASGSFATQRSDWTVGNHRFRINRGEEIRFEQRFYHRREVWFSTRISPDFGAPYFGESPASTIRRVLGSRIGAATIWNAIPWSWLIDYFLSVGSYLAATRGVLPWSIHNMNIMMMDRNVVWTQEKSSSIPNSVFRGGKKFTTIKRRFVYPVPKVRVTFEPNPLKGRLTVLSALAVANTKRLAV